MTTSGERTEEVIPVDDALLDAQVTRGAKTLRIPFSDPRVLEARAQGREALDAGYDVDTAYMIARQVLLAETDPVAGTCAA